jgi:hypothetical protein
MLGQITLPFTMNGLKLTQVFYVIDGLNRNFILGRDWLKENGVRLYFDLGLLRIDKTYVKLEEDIHISTILRLDKKIVIKPRTAMVCHVRFGNRFQLPKSGLVKVSNVDDECIFDDPGLMVQDSVHAITKSGKLPVVLINYTTRHYNFKRGSVIGKLTPMEVNEITTLDDMQEEDENQVISEDFKDIQVPVEHKKALWQIIRENQDLFAKTDSELGQSDTVKMRIDTGDHRPIKNRPYRAPLNKRVVIEKALDEMLKAKVIERSMSPWAFPLVVVKKKDGSDRMCVDFRSLNKVVEPASFPLPLIDDILALLGGSTCFSSLDMKSGYWQVKLDDGSKCKTAFACHKGLFQFNVMPFGLHNAPAVFQELMNTVLQGCEDFAIAYLDDILIFSKNSEEHKKHIKIVFDRLRKHDLKLKLKKCAFFASETEYLGFIVSKDGVKPNPKKVEAIKSMPPPKSVREVRGFIGTCSYYRRFIPNFSQIAEPLINLTKKFARFKWTSECQTAFDYLKDSLAVVPLLAYPDTNKPYVLYCDSSCHSIGASLTQLTDSGDEKPIYFLSHKLSPCQSRWSTIEKEGFAIYYALQKLDHYLHNARFVIRTDHKPLKYILDSPMQNRKIQQWALSIAGYDCTVDYIAGKENHCADLLSRIPDQPGKEESDFSCESEPDIDDRTFEINTINSNKFDPKSFASCQVEPSDEISIPDIKLTGVIDMQVEQGEDENIMKLKARLEKETATKYEQSHFFETQGILYYLSQADSEDPRLRVYLPHKFESVALGQYHDQLGHMALDKTYDSLRLKYYFPNMYKKINSYIEKCVTCQVMSDRKPKPPQQETDIPPYPFAKIGLDLSGPYPTTLSGNKYIVSFIDIYSGWPEAFSVPSKEADNIVHLLLEEIVPRHGCMLEILTDNGSENLNRKVKETLEAMNIHHITTSFYSPQANGRVERFHRTLHAVMAKKILEDVKTWDLYLNQTLAAIRFHVNESSKYSPFYLLYNRDVVLPLDTILKPRRRYMGEDLHQIALQEQHKAFLLVHKNLKESKKKQKRLADRNSKDEHFKVDDPVYLRNHRRNNKLECKWTPFYRITKQTGPLSFMVHNQLNGTSVKTHARHIRHADIEWQVPTEADKRLLRKSNYVVPPDSDSTSESEDEQAGLEKAIHFKRLEREASSDEDEIPLMELRRRLQMRDKHAQDIQSQVEKNETDDETQLKMEFSDKSGSDEADTEVSDFQADDRSGEVDMEVNEVGVLKTDSLQKVASEVRIAEDKRDAKVLVKNLLDAVQAML